MSLLSNASKKIDCHPESATPMHEQTPTLEDSSLYSVWWKRIFIAGLEHDDLTSYDGKAKLIIQYKMASAASLIAKQSRDSRPLVFASSSEPLLPCPYCIGVSLSAWQCLLRVSPPYSSHRGLLA